MCVCVCVRARVFYFWVFPNESALKRGSTERGYNPVIIIIRYCLYHEVFPSALVEVPYIDIKENDMLRLKFTKSIYNPILA